MPSFPRLFSPIRLRNTEIRNRILSTGHQTYLARGGLPARPRIRSNALNDWIVV